MYYKGLLSTYYAFTSLSTVGFGDYNPKANIERVFCAFILLFGVSIFSYIMGIFIEILDEYQKLNASLDEGDLLTQFINLLTRFNSGKPLNKEFTDKMYEFFDYKWSHDLLMAIDDDSEIALLEQLPEFV